MLLVRQVFTGIVIAAALALLTLSVYQLSFNNASGDPATNTALASDLDERARVFQEKLDAYSRRVNDMETMVIILLGITGLYTIIFILTTDINARGVARQVDRAMANVNEDIRESMTELRRLKDETRDTLRSEVREAAKRLDQHAHEVIRQLRGEGGAIAVTPEVVRELQTIEERISALSEMSSPDHDQEVVHYEGALPALELLHSRTLGPQLARVYRHLARYYRGRDAARQRFYLVRAAALAPNDFEIANEAGFMALDAQKPDYQTARRHFEASLRAHPDQQRAQYGLALVFKAESDLEAAQGLLESALESADWETAPDAKKSALVHYALACVMTLRGRDAEPGYRAPSLIHATEHLQEAFAYPSRQLEQMLSRDTEDDGDLAVLANTSPYDNAVNDLLLNLSIGAA